MVDLAEKCAKCGATGVELFRVEPLNPNQQTPQFCLPHAIDRGVLAAPKELKGGRREFARRQRLERAGVSSKAESRADV
jgi:hypothetical protein